MAPRGYLDHQHRQRHRQRRSHSSRGPRRSRATPFSTRDGEVGHRPLHVELVHAELAKIHESVRSLHEAVYALFEDVPTVAEEHRHNTLPIMFASITTPDALLVELRGILPGKDDASHVFTAVKNGLDYFVTCDVRTILIHTAKVEAIVLDQAPQSVSTCPRARRGPHVVGVERRSKLLVGALQPSCVGVLDLHDRRAHDRREVPERNVAFDRPRRERVATVVDPTVLEPGRAERRRPLAVAEPLDVDVAAACAGKRIGVSILGGIASSASRTR